MRKIKNILGRGAATLPAVMVLAVLTLAVAVGITAVSLTESFISESGAQSANALFYAETGVRDALTKVARNKSYSCTAADCYAIEFVPGGCSGAFDGCAHVSVSADIGTTGAPKIVTSEGIVKSSLRTLRVNVVLDGGTATDGGITSTVWTELTN
jgi:Tfp pilus assembly protein PilX